MTSFTVTVTGDRELSLALEALPARIRKVLLERITGLTERLYAEVVSAEPHETGELRSDTAMRVDERDDRITGRVFIDADFAKAAALEYGAHRATEVRAHAEQLGHIFGRLIDPITVIVSTHLRQVNISEHRFLRGSLNDLEATVTTELQEALAEAIAGL